ncbi:helix-turn-helix domain-containing protein (plasmid) [Microvirga sp. RSM25]|uniref:helix-turn-helix domain-containing protein n=1 Tax=Microvirga sp. RSM25 TaxID=3273802 RepID=UPI0038510DFD
MAPVCIREMTAAERAAVQKLAHSRTAPAQSVQRAQIILRASRGESASAIATRVGLDGETVRKRIRRFNAEGLGALKDRYRSGRPPTYTSEQTATVIATALPSLRPSGCRLPPGRSTVGPPTCMKRRVSQCGAAALRYPTPRRPALAQARDLVWRAG